ncbi:hypothetical protein AB1P65_09455 [Roseibium alexandrii]
MAEEITKLSIIVDQEEGEAELTRSFHRYFAGVGAEDPQTASGMLNDLIGELIDIRESIFLAGFEEDPHVEPALNTSFGLMTLSDAEEIMRKRYFDELSEINKKQLRDELERKVRRGMV